MDAIEGNDLDHLMMATKKSLTRRSGKTRNVHPGSVLEQEFLLPMGITAYRMSKDIGIPQTRMSEILKGNRRITADTALRLSRYFGKSAKFWLGLQDDFDLEEEGRAKKAELDEIVSVARSAA